MSMTMSSYPFPRFASRLIQNEGGNPHSDLHMHNQKRLQAIPVLFQSDDCLTNGGGEFSIKQFISPGATTPNKTQQIRKNFRQFLNEIAPYCGDENNAALIIFNIFENSVSDSEALESIKSYFGPISDSQFNKLRESVRPLIQAAREVRSRHNMSSSNYCEISVPILNFEEFETEKWQKSATSTFQSAKDLQLLQRLCEEYCRRHDTFTFDQFLLECWSLARSSTSAGEFQERLFEIVGEGEIEFLFEVCSYYDVLRLLPNLHLPKKSNGSNDDRINKNIIPELDHQSKSSASNSSRSICNDIGQVNVDWLQEVGFSEQYLEQERLLGLRSEAAATENWYDNLNPEGTLEYHEKRGLPANTVRTIRPGYEEYFIPAPEKKNQHSTVNLIRIQDLEEWAQLAFSGITTLNTIQSNVFNVAYNSLENMLICAPTGAGKTNIAMLAYLSLIRQNLSDGNVSASGVKAIYIAPMKALAQEVVVKFSERLKPLKMVVREFTGDMQLTKQEIVDSNLIVTTPEKWDVVTRKGGDGSLGTMVSLIIIDEVHLLAEDRGAVLESIVARTQRYIESSQKFVRIVGLSATLPNYKDVASFLRVNHNIGLFHFGPEYRPVPLDQTFIGVTEKQRMKRNEIMNYHAYEKTIAALAKGKQVMIFVHSRKDTSKTLQALLDIIAKHNTYEFFHNESHEQFSRWKKQVDKSKNQEVQQFFGYALGIHHAGMLRPDRTLTEQLFEAGLIKVLCCTATLAWGVNLPAHTVIIKGTELYDPERGGFVDISILDVFQIFGRAGRPQYDNCGHAIMITSFKSLHSYLGLLNNQAPIESTFIKSLPDHLNAEIVNGTVNNIKEACMWLSYTFLFIRMCKNPIAYGISFDEVFVDSRLEAKRNELIRNASRTLDQAMMIRFDPSSGNLAVTDIGRIASHYYIKHETIEAFNTMLNAYLDLPDAIHVLCSSSEFDQLRVRPEELAEIDELKKATSIKVKSGAEETSGKVNILLQSFMSNKRISSFTLQSDSNYVGQNAGRICRALFEMSLKRGWSSLALLYLNLSKGIEKRMLLSQSPLRQFPDLPFDLISKIEKWGLDVPAILEMSDKDVGEMCHSSKHGKLIQSIARQLPKLQTKVDVFPITSGIIRLRITIRADFVWNIKAHEFLQPFWIWVEDSENEFIYHSETVNIQYATRQEERVVEITVPVRQPLPAQYYIRIVSDRWVGCEDVHPVSFKHLMLPVNMQQHTELLDINPISKTALHNELYEELFSKFDFFNPVQSQMFHTLYNTDSNILVGAPTGSGKTITAEISILRLLNTSPGGKVVYIAPLKALTKERVVDWQNKFNKLGLSVVELTGDITPDMAMLKKSDIIITTPEKWDGITRGWDSRNYVQRVELLIIDEIHLLGGDRGHVLEVIVSRMRHISLNTQRKIRFVGLSTALANARDLADWLGIKNIGLYNFHPSVRPIPMSVYIQGFPGKHYCPRMATMNKPVYASIMEHSPLKPVLVFVSSRRQTRLTALDLISFCASDDNPKQFLHLEEDAITAIAETLSDSALRDTIVFGIGIHHAGLSDHDRTTVEKLFVEGNIQVLVCTSTLAWGVNFPAHLVVIKGTEYFDGKSKTYVDFPVTDVLQMMGRAGRPQFDDSGVACILVHEPKKNFYKKFLHEPFPVESCLHNYLHNHINAEAAHGSIDNIDGCIDFLSWTYFFRRLLMNPSYYQLAAVTPECIRDYMFNLFHNVLNELILAGCISTTENFSKITSTKVGQIAAFYYLDYRTIKIIQQKLKVILSTITKAASNDNKCTVADIAIKDLVLVMCSALEFSEIPVRHNEDLMNSSLAATLPWSSERKGLDDMSSPHTKSFLLLQARFFNAALPIADYINDTKSVLDQAPRVLNAMIEVAATVECSYNFLEVSIKLLQSLYTGLIDSDASRELLQLPYITQELCSEMGKRGLGSLKSLMMNRKSVGNFKFLSTYMTLQQLERFMLYLKDLPLLRFQFKCFQINSSTNIMNNEGLVAGSSVACQFTLMNDAMKHLKVYLPKYSKPKTLSWFVIIACGSEVLSFKRLTSIGKMHELSMQLIVPSSVGKHSLQIVVESDCLAGLALQECVDINIVN